MSKKKDIVPGSKYNRWTVISEGPPGKRFLRTVNCVCECGEEKLLNFTDVYTGKTKSCGCYQKDSLVARSKTHGMSNTRTYRIWRSMQNRCNRTGFISYDLYGGDGVIVCDRWDKSKGGTFENFLEDMGECPEGLSINRIKGAKIYSKDTCEWVDSTYQARDQKASKLSKTGIRGVRPTRAGNKYGVYLTVDCLVMYFGVYEDFFEACCVRLSAELKYWKDINKEVSCER